MNPIADRQNAHIEFFYARAYAVVCVFAVAVSHCSTGLIQADVSRQNARGVVAEQKSSSNAEFSRLRKNRDLTKQNFSGVEATLVESLLTDPSSVVRQGAAQSLGNYVQNPAVVRALASALRSDSERSVRYACALALGLSPTFKALRALETASDDPDPALRRQIAFSLKQHRSGANRIKAQQLLKRLSRDDDASVREMAQDSK